MNPIKKMSFVVLLLLLTILCNIIYSNTHTDFNFTTFSKTNIYSTSQTYFDFEKESFSNKNIPNNLENSIGLQKSEQDHGFIKASSKIKRKSNKLGKARYQLVARFFRISIDEKKKLVLPSREVSSIEGYQKVYDPLLVIEITPD